MENKLKVFEYNDGLVGVAEDVAKYIEININNAEEMEEVKETINRLKNEFKRRIVQVNSHPMGGYIINLMECVEND